MRLLGVELGDFSELGLLPGVYAERLTPIPLAGLTVLLGQNGSGKSRLLEMIEGVLTAEGPRLPRQFRMASEPILPHGEAILELERVKEPDGDWPWLMQLLDVLSPDEYDTPYGLQLCHLGWHPVRQAGWRNRPDEGEVGYFRFADEDEYRDEALEYEVLPDSFEAWTERLMSLIHFHEEGTSAAAVNVSIFQAIESSVVVSVQFFGGGEVRLRWPEPDEERRTQILALLSTSKSEPLGAALVENLAEVGSRWPAVLSLGAGGGESGGRLRSVPAPIRVTRIEDRFDDPARLADAWLTTQRPDGAPYWERTETGQVVAAWVVEALRRLGLEADRRAPSFLAEKGTIEVRYLGHEEDHPDGPSSVVALAPPDGGIHEWIGLGAGTRRWVAAAVKMATERLHDIESTGEEPARVLIVDEPELHLHPTLQQSVASWLADQAAGGATVIAATHSHLMLDTTPPPNEILGVVRPTGSRAIALIPMADDLLDAIGRSGDGLLDSLGLDPSAAIALTKGVLIVEGEHDRKLIERFCKAELDRHRIRVQPIRGTNNAKAFASVEMWGLFGKRLCVMFDDTWDGEPKPGEKRTKEDRERLALLAQSDHWREAGFDITSVEFSLPDVIAALPTAAVNRAYPGRPAGWSWPAIASAWRQQTPPVGFKPFALGRLGLKDLHPDQFVDDVLAACRPADEPDPRLTASVDGAIAHLLEPMRPRS